MKQGARFAHIPDLHIGRSAESDDNAARLCTALVAFGIDQVIATGDVTHRGLECELATFEAMFAPLASQGRLIVVPGNDDCLGDDISGRLMAGTRVQVSSNPGVHCVRVNSTAPHNRSWFNGHGSLDDSDLDAIDAALDAAPAGVLVVIALHHHVLPMPEEHVAERLSSWLGSAFTSELRKGRDLLQRVRDKCDLVLHGHRHVPRGARLFGSPARHARLQRWIVDGDGSRPRLPPRRRRPSPGPPLWLDVPAPWAAAAEAFDPDTQVAAPLAV